MQLYPKEDDLVLLWLPENTGAYAEDEPGFPKQSPHFGCVSQSNVFNDGGVLLCMLALILFFFSSFYEI